MYSSDITNGGRIPQLVRSEEEITKVLQNLDSVLSEEEKKRNDQG